MDSRFRGEHGARIRGGGSARGAPHDARRGDAACDARPSCHSQAQRYPASSLGERVACYVSGAEGRLMHATQRSVPSSQGRSRPYRTYRCYLMGLSGRQAGLRSHCNLRKSKLWVASSKLSFSFCSHNAELCPSSHYRNLRSVSLRNRSSMMQMFLGSRSNMKGGERSRSASGTRGERETRDV